MSRPTLTAHPGTASGALLFCATVLLAACSPQQQQGGNLDRARQQLDQGHATAALFEARNLLQQNSLNADAQLLLGRVFAAQGDIATAELELRKAEKLGIDPTTVAVALAETLLASGQYQRLLDEWKPAADAAGPSSSKPRGASNGEDAAELLAIRGLALLSLGRDQAAAAAFSEALLVAPAGVRALLGQAHLALLAKDPQKATALADRALAAQPKSALVWQTKADIAQASGKPDQAILALQQAVKLAPGKVMTRLALARLQIENDQFVDAQAQLAQLRKLAPKHPMVNHTQAVLYFSQRQFAAARDAALLAVAAAPDYLPAVRLLAEAELETGHLQQAQKRLQQLLQAYPDSPAVRRFYAAAMLRINQPALALEALAPLLAQTKTAVEPELLSMAGQAHMQIGDYSKASALMARAVAAQPAAAAASPSAAQAASQANAQSTAVNGLVALGVRQVARGDTEQGLAELEKAAALDAQGTSADFVLVLTYLKTRAFDRALAATSRLQAKQPANPVVHNLAATAYIGKGDRAAARSSLERALALDASFVPAALNLAVLDLDQGQPALARQRLEAVLAKDPGNVDAITALARMSGQPGELSRLLVKARNADAKAVGVSLLLLRQYLVDNDVTAALRVAQELQLAAPDNADVLTALAEAQLAAGQRQQALITYTALLAKTPNSAAASVRLGEVHEALQDDQSAEAAYAKAITMSPDFSAAVAAMVRLLARTGRADEALKMAEDWRKRGPKSPLGDELRGDVYALQNQFAPAARAYDAAYALAPSGGMAVKHHGATRRAGGKVDGRRLQQWLSQHPQDLTTHQYLADQQLDAGEWAAAAENYRLVITARPGNFFAINNLANAYLLLKDPRALVTAQAALALSPNDANIMDTVGQALTESGAAAQALPVLRKAISLNPEQTMYRVHLALALARSGDKPAARDEVKRLMAVGKPVQLDAALREALK
jgi:putative PEP-CTERM system TPR-repeat lipoprotein